MMLIPKEIITKAMEFNVAELDAALKRSLIWMTAISVIEAKFTGLTHDQGGPVFVYACVFHDNNPKCVKVDMDVYVRIDFVDHNPYRKEYTYFAYT